MRKPSSIRTSLGKDAQSAGMSPFKRAMNGISIDAGKFKEVLAGIDEQLVAGLAAKAEHACLEFLENYANSIDGQAELNYRLSVAFEMQGRFQECLEILKPFESEEVAKSIRPENLILLYTRIAVSHANQNNSPKAITFLKISLTLAEERGFTHLYPSIYLAFAGIYRVLSEYPIARNYLEKAKKYSQMLGDWKSLAECYRLTASTYSRESRHQQALEYYQQAIRIIGDRFAPYMLGRIYTLLGGVHLFLLDPKEGVSAINKAIAVFEKTGEKYEVAVAYNNLCSNYLFMGEWRKAEAAIRRAVELATEVNHVDLSPIIASLGELELLRGNYAEAEKHFNKSVEIAEVRNNEWYLIQVVYQLSQCLLAQHKIASAMQKADEVVQRCENIKETRIRTYAQTVLAECYLRQKKSREAEAILYAIEENEAYSSVLVQGGVSRLRGLLAAENGDYTLTVHHFNRSLSIFEKSGDPYQTSLLNLLLGQVLAKNEPDTAAKHLEAAAQVFRRLGIEGKLKEADELAAKLADQKINQPASNVSNSYLMMLRVVESISTRESLFRELISVIQEDGKAKKTILAELNGEEKFSAKLIDGFSPVENAELLEKIEKVSANGGLDRFIANQNLSVIEFRSPNASPAMLVTSPALGTTLSDGASIKPLLRVVELGMEVCALRDRHREAGDDLEAGNFSSQNLMPGFVHSSPVMTELVDEIQKIRSSDVIVLITGESGTGKELIAKAVHLSSKRRDKVFIPFNCTAVPKELTEGHLFGYKKGSFTGAASDYEGVIRAADGGTLFLDEIGDLPLDVQPKILRFLQEGEVQTIGEKSPRKVDVRIIAATNMNLEEKVLQGLFREDLYYRLNVIRLRVPPLRDRRSEIPELVNYYIQHYSGKFGRQDLSISSEALDLLIAYNWKGNIRQLCNEIQRIVARSESGDRISPAHLSQELRPIENLVNSGRTGKVRAVSLTGGLINIQTLGGTLDEIVSALEIQLIADSLLRNNNNISRVAKELGITRRGLYLKMERFKLKGTSD